MQVCVRVQGWRREAGVALLHWKHVHVAMMGEREEGQEGRGRGLSGSLWPPRGPAGFGDSSATVGPF